MNANAAVTVLAALAQETRLAVFRLLVQQGRTGKAAGEIAAELGLPPATLSFHLKELSNAGLVTARQAGRFIFYAADFDAMEGLVRFLTENCCAADGTTCAAADCAPKQCGSAPGRRAERKPGRTAK